MIDYEKLPFSDPFKKFLEKVELDNNHNMQIILRHIPLGDPIDSIFGLPLKKVNLGIIVDELKQANMQWWEMNWGRLHARLKGDYYD